MKKLRPMTRARPGIVLLAGLVLALVCVAVFAPVFATHDPLNAPLAQARHAPSASHWFGTDALGRDVYSRIIYGTRASLAATCSLVLLVLVVGTALGVIAAFFGGVVDVVIMRVTDAMLAFPDLILALAVVGILGPNITNAIIAIALVSWTKYARLARSLVLKVLSQDYIAAARMTGSTNRRILWRYLTPNVAPTMVITAANDIGTVMISLASMSFLGFGMQPPTPEWGYMLSEGREFFSSAPWLLLFPGAAIFVTVAVFNLLGDALRDALDVRQTSVELLTATN